MQAVLASYPAKMNGTEATRPMFLLTMNIKQSIAATGTWIHIYIYIYLFEKSTNEKWGILANEGNRTRTMRRKTPTTGLKIRWPDKAFL